MRMRVLPAALTAAVLLAGCDWSQKMAGRIAPDTVSLADRCGEIMQKAMPFAEIEIGDRTSESTGIRTIVAHVQGTRTDIPQNGEVARDLAAECTFQNNVLTAFRWTKGGPPAE